MSKSERFYMAVNELMVVKMEELFPFLFNYVFQIFVL